MVNLSLSACYSSLLFFHTLYICEILWGITVRTSTQLLDDVLVLGSCRYTENNKLSDLYCCDPLKSSDLHNNNPLRLEALIKHVWVSVQTLTRCDKLIVEDDKQRKEKKRWPKIWGQKSSQSLSYDILTQRLISDVCFNTEKPLYLRNITACSCWATVFQLSGLSCIKTDIFPNWFRGMNGSGQAMVLILTAASTNTINLQSLERVF